MKKLLALMMVCVLVLAAFAGCGSSGGDDGTDATFPQKEITLIMPYTAGGEGDNIFRCIEEKLNSTLGVSVVAEYVTGGNGIPAVQQMLNSPADGYTICMVAAGTASIQPHMGTAKYTTSDLKGISCLTAGPVLFAVNDKCGFTTFEEWEAYAKANPSAFKFATGSTGGTPHLAMMKMLMSEGVETTFVPHSGNAEAYAACLGGHVDGYAAVASGVLGKEGLHILANLGSAEVEGVPSLGDLGLDESLATDAYFGLVCHPDTPDEIVQVIDAAVAECMEDPAVQEKFANLNLTMYYLSTTDFDAYMQEQSDGYAEVISELGLAK